MNVLVIGATGLIGGHAYAALQAAGHSVTGASRRQPAGADDWIELDFPGMTQAQDWLPYLAGFDAVINCVGIIREAVPGDFDLLHRAVPVALFAACEQLGIRRVVQVSALGSHINAATPYWRSKGAAEQDLLGRNFGTIIRPSLVYGLHGASSRVFRTMATLPFLLMPMATKARVQPIHVEELSRAIVLLLTHPNPPREMAVVGPRAMTMAEYLGALRQGMQAPCGLVLDLPLPLARLTASIAQHIPSSALTPDSLTMLVKSADGSNTADATAVTTLLGKAPRDPASFASPDQRPTAALVWAQPLLRVTLALLWLITAYASWFGYPHAQSLQWLAHCGVPPAAQENVLLAASLLDASIGIALLAGVKRFIWPLQLGIVMGYTAIMSICLPQFWLHPFGVLSKNLPLLGLMFVLWRLEGSRR